jgi:arsenate reductase
MKNVLVLCTGNSCRSIMAEALINKELSEFGIKAYSSGVAPSGKVNPDAMRALQDINIDTSEFRSKNISELDGIDFDLVVTVCDHANETCPIFAKPVAKTHCGFEDPSGKEYAEYTKTRDLIKEILIPIVKAKLA